jgi:hypothetical protein
MLRERKKSLKNAYIQKATNHLMNLQCQGPCFKEINTSISKTNIELWSKTLESNAANKLIFAHKALSQVLPTSSNLVRWGRSSDPTCHLCASGLPQTNKHVLSNCSAEVALLRYTKRHNDILLIIVDWLKTALSNSRKVYADLPGCLPINELFHDCRPDIAICSDKEINALELTTCNQSTKI